MAFSIPTATSHELVPNVASTIAGSEMDLVCFSHLRWGFVWQRPQHLLTRFTKFARVFVVEEPVLLDGSEPAHLRAEKSAGVTVLTPHLPLQAGMDGGFNRRTNAQVRALLTPYLRDHNVSANSVHWYYTPMALGAEPNDFTPSLVVFDAMDELANFRGAPAELRAQEQKLLERADLVFAGGPSLHEARKDRHRKAYCFPSGVDAAHFRAESVPNLPDDIAELMRPVIGFYGVLDERIDFPLIGAIATERPDWSIVLIGPLAKITEADLATGPNIHYLGKQSYDELPAYLTAFDVAIMPFARNESTRFISPTKTLEYLAGGKPIVSTPIEDVVTLYGEVVEIAEDAGAFVDYIEAHLSATPEEIDRRNRLAEAILARHEWDRIARGMSRLMHEAIYEKRATAARISSRIPVGRVSRSPVAVGAELAAD